MSKKRISYLLFISTSISCMETPQSRCQIYEEQVINLELSNGYTCIHEDAQAIQLLADRIDQRIKNNRNLDMPICIHGTTPLFLASSSDLANGLVEKLLAHGANPNLGCGSDFKTTPLAHAVKCIAVQNVKSLLAAGANPDLSGESETPVFIAHWHIGGLYTTQYSKIIEALLAAGANPNPCDSLKNTPLLLFLSRGNCDDTNLVKLFLEYGAYTHFKKNNYETVAWYARYAGRESVRKLAHFILQERKPIHLSRVLWGKRAKESIFNKLPKEIVMLIAESSYQKSKD